MARDNVGGAGVRRLFEAPAMEPSSGVRVLCRRDHRDPWSRLLVLIRDAIAAADRRDHNSPEEIGPAVLKTCANIRVQGADAHDKRRSTRST